jgi:hypothetical protein
LIGAVKKSKAILSYLFNQHEKAKIVIDFSIIAIKDCGEEDKYDYVKCFEVNGSKIDVASPDDDGKAVSNNINLFICHDCDIVTPTCTNDSFIC